MMKRQIEFVPSLISEKAFTKEYEENWAGDLQKVNEFGIIHEANIISSNVLYKIKTDEESTRKMKARLCPQGEEDKEKESFLGKISKCTIDHTRNTLIYIHVPQTLYLNSRRQI